MPFNDEELSALENEFSEDANRVREFIEDSETVDEPEPEVGESEVEEGGEQVEGEGGEASASAPPEPQFVDVAGRQLRVDEAQALVEFYEWARQNPEVMANVNGYLSGQYELVPKGQQPQTPAPAAPEDDAWDDVDPVVREKLRQLDEIQNELAGFRQAQMQSAVVQAQSQLTAGRDRFNQRYELTDEQLSSLEQETAALGILPSLITKHNGDRVAAVEEALETAYWRSEEFRAREFDRRQQAEKKTRERTSKASKLAGSSGSVPRNRAEPSTPEARKEAMIAEIAEAMQNN